jgi:4-hydroxybenzoate polyprenyltransferase
MRPHQWVKNLFVALPLVFAQELFHVHVALRVAAALGLFCLASSAVYILNDLVDVDADRAHPLKRNRPIASGRVPVSVVRPFAVGLVIVVVAGGALISLSFLAAVAGYLVLNLAYSLKLKQLPYLDVLSIAAGFELRVLGGAYAAPVPPSLYLLLVTALLALFLGFGKRRHELAQGADVAKQRKVLEGYDARALDILLFVTAIGTIAGYAVYTFDPATREAFGTDYLGITTVFTMFGVIRFLHLVRSRPRSESPTEDMIRDAPFILNLLLWGAAVVFLIYLGT